MTDRYTVETDPPILPLRQGSTGTGVRRVQEWLSLHGRGVMIDGEYGPATARAVGEFQRVGQNASTLQSFDGGVDRSTWDALVNPLRAASDRLQMSSFGGAVVSMARRHLDRQAREVGGDNRGPWVRHYCRGHQVAWCQGFASTIWADASRNTGIMSPLDLVLDGIWCLFVPRMVAEARRQSRFVDGRNPAGAAIPAGSMFFLRGGQYGYTHVGLVEAMHADGTMSTIEGNTNDEGSANGYEVARRIRRVAGADFGLAV